MSKFVSEQDASEAVKNGEKVGGTTPSPSTNGLWWEVYSYQGRLIAVCCDGKCGITCGQEISEAELPFYSD